VVPKLSTPGRLARLVWVALDRIDYAIMDTRLRLFDLIHGPERPRSADEDREQLLWPTRPIATFEEKPFGIGVIYSLRLRTILNSLDRIGLSAAGRIDIS
jgi:hypothetical protein